MGASFDPPHRGHRKILENSLKQNIFDEIWLMPAKLHAFSKSLTEPNHRLMMLQLFLENFKQKPVRIETYELEKENTNYSYDTLAHFSNIRPSDNFAWIIGSDNLAGFNRWHNYSDLLQRFSVYVYPRPNYQMDPLLPGMIPLKGVISVDISSTQVRNKVKAHEDVTDLVGKAVADYIKMNKLYLA